MTSKRDSMEFWSEMYEHAEKTGKRYGLDKGTQAESLLSLMHMFVREIDDIDERLRTLIRLEREFMLQTDHTRSQTADEIEYGPNYFMRDILAPGVTLADLDATDDEAPRPSRVRSRSARQIFSRLARTGTDRPASP
jgi:hypothetical protein